MGGLIGVSRFSASVVRAGLPLMIHAKQNVTLLAGGRASAGEWRP